MVESRLFPFGHFDFLNEMKSKSRAESEERESMLKTSEEMRTCEHPAQRVEVWISRGLS